MNNEEILVEVKGVSKKFCKNLKRSLWYGVKDLANDMLGLSSNSQKLREGEFWAVKDVSFELRRGECLGLIGHNGAGKSTLLKMLNGLIRPDEGEIRIRGKVGALIELGAGFNPVLTGRENVYINGQVLGFTKKEIDEKFDAIIDFAEIGDFIDTPVQNYSSGMKVRLGFAVAAQMEPDLLIIDEVLAVGDVGFRIKCYNLISELTRKTTIIFVSHSMPQVSRICTRVIYIDKGIIKTYENIYEGITKYLSLLNNANAISRIGNIELLNVKINSINFKKKPIKIEKEKEIKIELELNSSVEEHDLVLIIGVFDAELKVVVSVNVEPFNLTKCVQNVTILIPKINLIPGSYSFGISFYKRKEKGGTTIVEYIENALFLEIPIDKGLPVPITHAPIQYNIKSFL